MNERIAVIVQARMTSTRLPGKVLEALAGETVLAHVLRRCGMIDGADIVCCAVPAGAESNPVATEAERCGVHVFRGSETDVLDRYYHAALDCRADVVMRVTSDCPLIDPAVCSRLITLFRAQSVDYACNNMPPSWPHGLDCEIFSFDALALAAENATAADEREHVTPWLRSNPDMRRANLAGPGGDYTAMRWTLDYPEDLTFFRSVFELLPDMPENHGYEKTAQLLRDHPEIAAINADCRQRRSA
ncbi:MAG: glycosyltransferase family protein [Alphaproteobacteria bacterium]|nr:glycosyltransferase family protein [Alphaproteobacteria bacterium]